MFPENALQQIEVGFKAHFPHEPTSEQAELMEQLGLFLISHENPSAFILKGYAGTGKTSILGACIKTVRQMKGNTVLLAPTGRAAKVLAGRAGIPASTIHKRIYFIGSGPDGGVRLQLAPNKLKNTLFIVDEASMIGDYSMQSDGSISRNLLEDLMEYVFQGEGCKLILLGDEGQLPPVGSSESPALYIPYMESHFPRVHFWVYGLTQVVRQASESGILKNATAIRESQRNDSLPRIDLEHFSDVRAIPGDELISSLEESISKFGSDEVMVVTRSNKRANLYNMHIRNRILYMEEEICGGDLLMVVKNNYFWLDPMSSAGFIANGELLKIHRVRKFETVYGVRFVHLEVSLIDYPELDRFDTIAFMDTLQLEQPNLNRDYLKMLFFEIEKDYLHERNKQKRYQEIMKNPYFNALQIKFAYAVTCHKAQGGQWSAVYIDHGYLGEDPLDREFLRWLYTAFTRASEQLYTINLHEDLLPRI